MTTINQKEYLKRLKLIDDDADVLISKEIAQDIEAADEDAPQIVAVIDERPIALQIDEHTNTSLWKPLGEAPTSSTSNAKEFKSFKLNAKTGESTTVNRQQQSERGNYTPPRKNHSPRRKEQNYSPARRKNREVSPSRSPSPPPRKQVKDEDASPPRRRNKERDGNKRNRDVSPSRSPSPPRRGNREPDSSPPRRNRKEDSSPPRRATATIRLLEEETSPDTVPLLGNGLKWRTYHLPRRHRNVEEDASPPRRKPKTSASTRIKSEDEESSPTGRQKKTLDGKTAGLQSATELVKESKRLRQREDEIFKNMSAEASGRDAATVVRGKDKAKDPEEEAAKEKRQKELKEQYDRWGKGLKQVEDEREKMEEQLKEMSKPLARYADDEDLERHLKEQDRDGDPMLAYIRKKRRKEKVAAGIPEKPMYMGEFMPNRFGIPPGHRWDGVDRSNEYEKRWFQVQNAKKAKQEEAFKWSTEDIMSTGSGSPGAFCLVCNGSCLSTRNSVQIFNKEGHTGREHITSLLSNVLDRDIKEDPEQTQVLCKKCYKLLDELYELQNRVTEIKNEIFELHRGAVKKTEVEDENEDTKTESKSMEANKENEVPKKILDIPSSDEDSGQITEGKMQDIEMELVKMHGGMEEDEGHEKEHLEIDGQNFHSYTADNADIMDSGAMDHSSDSDYEPPNSVSVTENMVQVSVVEKTGAEFIKVKLEPDEPLTGPVGMEKPNILKKKTAMNAVNDAVEKQEDKKTEELLEVPIVSREGNIYTCLMCEGDETVAGEAKAIAVHMKQAHGARVYICDVCGQDFRKRNLLSAHLDEHVAAEEGDFQCEICNRIFSNLRLFRIHRRMHYPQTKAWECETCGKKYSSKNLLEEHVNTHLGVRPYVCSLCGKDFASKYTFKAHEKTHEVRPRPFRCVQCPKSFLSQQNLTQHERTHSGMKEYACHLCGKQFGSAHNLEVHSIVHTGYKPFVCGLCGKAFARKAEIRDHERTHTGERPYQCEFCGATFSQRSNLQSHKRATHYDDKRYQCSDCGKGFKRRRLLDYHVKAAHTGERPFKCDVCEATFVYPEHFKKHRRIHTGEKPFLCEVCGKAFNSRDNRNAHRFVHSDKKPYECLVCGAGFMRKPLLYQHMQAQGHLNDTIVVNQPRLTTDDDQLVTVNSAGEMEIVDAAAAAAADSKLYIQDQDGTEHIIIDGQQITFTETGSEEENEGEVIDEIEQVVAGHGDEDYEEIITADALAQGETQIIETPEGPIQLVKVRIPNENGEEEEAWIKIVPE
ncbi:hypothetical protein NQ315_001316 [Exocentrus adspersus]|uniref:BUD13 homolog n=1 Tax=Exocentrus adspersus TaxID=1586481 RepID=A0AAV8WET0_9CUCU|nr:hypothetical protein NQ315_001316 [Exocentrus adspersus]